MCKISEKQLMESVKNLKSWCKQHRVLVGECECPFNGGGVCSITDVAMPCEIKIPCRWTEEDYNLSKSLMKTNAAWIEREHNPELGNPIKWMYLGEENELTQGYIPTGLFNSLKLDEYKYLYEIVEEYKDCNNVSES